MPVEITLKVVRVDTSEGHLATGGTVSIGQVETKDGLIDQALVDKVVEGRDNTQDGNGVVSETKDTVKLAKGKSKTGLLDRLTKVLVLNDDATDVEVVVADDTFERSRAVLNTELGAVGLEGRGLVGVEAAVEEAGDGAAVGRRDPEVG